MVKTLVNQPSQLEYEHERLRARMRDVAFVLNDRYSPVSLVAQRLADLRDQISEHFITEEHSGLFGSLNDRSNRPSKEVRQLLDQHLQLYTQVATLSDEALRLSGTQIERMNLLDRFETFREALSQHEKAEGKLLRAAGDEANQLHA
jgi:hypothetical protein